MTVEVTQADREAAADAFDCRVLSNGRYDNDSRVQAFARHRIAHQGQVSGDMVEAVAWEILQALDGEYVSARAVDGDLTQCEVDGGLFDMRIIARKALAAMPTPTVKDSLTGDVAELVERLKDVRPMPWDDDIADICNEAAVKLTELAAEVERLRAEKD